MRAASWACCRFRRTNGEAGQAALLIVGISAFLTIVGLFAVNVAVLVASRTSVQRAADAAALAGCAELPDVSAAGTQVQAYAVTKNGGTGGSLERGNSATSSVSTAKLANDTLRVDASHDQSLIGYGSLGIGSMSVGAHATCTRDEGSRPVLLALGTGSGQLRVRSGASITMGQSGLVVASTSSSGLIVENAATVTGGYLDTASGNASISGTIDPPVTRAPAALLADPFAGVPEPVLGGAIDLEPYTLSVPGNLTLGDARPGCEGTSHIAPADTSPRNPQHCHFRNSGTLYPGIYWGGLELGDDSGSGTPMTITLSPGLYYLAGGGNVGGSLGGLIVYNGVTLLGNGVVIVNGHDPYAQLPARVGCGEIRIASDTNIQLTPPGPGSVYAGILFYQESSCTVAMTIGGNVILGPQIGTQGALYLKTAPVNFTGAATMHAIVVARQIAVADAVTFDVFIPSGTLYHGRLQLTE